MKYAYEYLINNKLLKKNDYVVVAVSGGPDSMVLLDVLIRLRKKIKINIVCAHVNHNVRSESESEKIFVEEYCKNNGVIFEYMKIEKYGNDNFHNEARNIRYKFFEDLIKKYAASILFTAHHGDDLMETVLMRLTRGSNLRGYAGFSKEMEKDSYKIIRPLVFYTKNEILEYAINNNINYVIDGSNAKDKYTRNRYRHNILPFFKAEDKDVHLKFLKFSQMILACNDYIEKNALNSLCSVYKDKQIYIDEYLKLDKIIQIKVLNYILSDIYNDEITLLNDKHIDSINNLIRSMKPNGYRMLPNNIIARRKYNKVFFQTNDDMVSDYKFELKNDIKLLNGKTFQIVEKEDSDSNYVCRLDSTEVSLPLYVRNRCSGDKIAVKNLNGSKKIKDIFID